MRLFLPALLMICYLGVIIAQPASELLEKIKKVSYPNIPDTGTGVSSAYLIVPEIAKIKIKGYR